MTEDELVLLDLDPYLALAELVGDILGILDELPDPPYLHVWVGRESIDVLSQFLSKGNISGLIFCSL